MNRIVLLDQPILPSTDETLVRLTGVITSIKRPYIIIDNTQICDIELIDTPPSLNMTVQLFGYFEKMPLMTQEFEMKNECLFLVQLMRQTPTLDLKMFTKTVKICNQLMNGTHLSDR